MAVDWSRKEFVTHLVSLLNSSYYSDLICPRLSSSKTGKDKITKRAGSHMYIPFD